mmetsp:Transcript_1912/g.11777  ORF Transcript_1912/g.11777 Transcript_1912/m.11777 type:complete len:452 (-) Transcript_1912:135-1490(-)
MDHGHARRGTTPGDVQDNDSIRTDVRSCAAEPSSSNTTRRITCLRDARVRNRSRAACVYNPHAGRDEAPESSSPFSPALGRSGKRDLQHRAVFVFQIQRVSLHSLPRIECGGGRRELDEYEIDLFSLDFLTVPGDVPHVLESLERPEYVGDLAFRYVERNPVQVQGRRSFLGEVHHVPRSAHARGGPACAHHARAHAHRLRTSYATRDGPCHPATHPRSTAVAQVCARITGIIHALAHPHGLLLLHAVSPAHPTLHHSAKHLISAAGHVHAHPSFHAHAHAHAGHGRVVTTARRHAAHHSSHLSLSTAGSQGGVSHASACTLLSRHGFFRRLSISTLSLLSAGGAALGRFDLQSAGAVIVRIGPTLPTRVHAPGGHGRRVVRKVHESNIPSNRPSSASFHATASRPTSCVAPSVAVQVFDVSLVHAFARTFRSCPCGCGCPRIRPAGRTAS